MLGVRWKRIVLFCGVYALKRLGWLMLMVYHFCDMSIVVTAGHTQHALLGVCSWHMRC